MASSNKYHRIVFCDFDGTITEQETFVGMLKKFATERFDKIDQSVRARNMTLKEGVRSLYGATKFAAELLMLEYIDVYGIRGVIDRCGVIAGSWQMGKVDQGFVALWVLSHFFYRRLNYIGFNGTGKQVRDILHIKDLVDLIDIQLCNSSNINGEIYNVGGGIKNTVSLLELTEICLDVLGNKIEIGRIKEDRNICKIVDF